MEKYNVIVYKKAKEKLLTFAKFIAKVNSNSAYSFIKKFEKIVASLSTFPMRGQLVSNNKRYRKINISKSFAIIYLIKEDNVYVLDIIDFRQFQ